MSMAAVGREQEIQCRCVNTMLGTNPAAGTPWEPRPTACLFAPPMSKPSVFSKSALRNRTADAHSLRHLAAAWLPLVLWLAFVFGMSTDRFSSASTGSMLGWILDQLRPGWQYRHPHAFAILHFYTRKMAHFTEYAVLAVLVWRAVSLTWGRKRMVWLWTWIFCALYAVTDELHQMLVPSRTPSSHDVLIDACGALAALIVVTVADQVAAKRSTEPVVRA